MRVSRANPSPEQIHTCAGGMLRHSSSFGVRVGTHVHSLLTHNVRRQGLQSPNVLPHPQASNTPSLTG